MDLATVSEEIFDGKLHFLGSDNNEKIYSFFWEKTWKPIGGDCWLRAE